MLTELMTRLSGQLPTDRWEGVEIAEDIDTLAALAGQVASGTAIVMPWREQGSDQQLATGGFRQRVRVQFLVGTVVRHYDPMLGAERAVQFDRLKADVETALAGWIPPGCTDPCDLVGGESSPIATGVSIYVQTWETTRNLTGAP